MLKWATPLIATILTSLGDSRLIILLTVVAAKAGISGPALGRRPGPPLSRERRSGLAEPAQKSDPGAFHREAGVPGEARKVRLPRPHLDRRGAGDPRTLRRRGAGSGR